MAERTTDVSTLDSKGIDGKGIKRGVNDRK
jgi:hypothetical protein